MTPIRRGILRKIDLLPYVGNKSRIVEGLSRHESSSKRSLSSSSSSSQPIVEICEDFLFPQHSESYFNNLKDFSKGYYDQPSRLCFASRPNLGGPLHLATRVYYFSGGLAELQEERKKQGNSRVGNDFHASLQSQQNSIYVEAPLVKENEHEFAIGLENTTIGSYEMEGITSNSDKESEDCILEYRRYNLKLGYDTVPKFLEFYRAGLPSKLGAPGTDPSTNLVTLLYSEVGRLNEVIEIWRHGDGIPAMERSRVAARKAQEWRSAIAKIADLAVEFRSTIHQPLVAGPD